MSDLISRQAAIDAILDLTDFASVIELFEYVEEHDLQDKRSGGIIDAIDAVLLLPSAQPEVLACGEGELTVQPERKTGRWLPDNDSVYEMRFICSECKESQVVPTIGFTKYKPIWDFCPNCGSYNGGEDDG